MNSVLAAFVQQRESLRYLLTIGFAAAIVFGASLPAAAQKGEPIRPRPPTPITPPMRTLPPPSAPSISPTRPSSPAHVPAAPAATQSRRRSTHATVCGNPKVACNTIVTFEPHDLPFRMGEDSAIVDTLPFYGIILKSFAAKDDDCEHFVSEEERLAAQALFPDHKVFSSRCVEPGNFYYTDESRGRTVRLSDNKRIMAVYAGATLAQARAFLAKVKATGKFPGANIRRMTAGFNGT